MSEQESDFPPWEDATEDLKSNIIEATPKQAEKIKSHRDIVRITPIEATSLEDDLEPEEYSPKTPYVVRATNRRDKDACHVTHASLKDIFQDQLQPQELGTHGVGLWKVNSTSDQVPLAAKIQGVRSIVPLDQYLLKEAETSATRKRRMIRPIAIHYQDRCKSTDNALKDLFGANVAMADESSSSDRGGLLYTVLLRRSPDANTNVDLIPNALAREDLSSWVDIDEQTISKTISATSGEISTIRRRPDFERVIRLEAATDQISQVESLDGVKSVQPNLHNLNRRYVAGRYYIDPLDRENQEQCAETGASLAKLLGEHNCDPYNSVSDGKLSKWTADLSNEQVAQVKAIHGVKGVRPVPRGRRCRLGIKSTHSLESQAQQEILYETQSGAPTELVSISQPSTIPQLRDLKNYVHESHCGGQSFLYYVETGVAFKAQREEFRNIASQHLLTDMAMENGDKPWFDDDDEGEDDEDMHSHGTCGAGKALGTRFGVSKKATLIVVRMHEVTSEEFQAALELILADLEDHPERQKNSVVTMSLTLGQDWEEDDNLPGFTELFQKLFAMDVPLVCISGNIEEGFEEPEVDEYPPLMEGPDLPLIVVGSVDSTGNRSEFSKGGPHVTLHAVGDPIECLPRDSKDPVERAGTSYAAPQVAGEIANLLSYEKVPFDTSDGNLNGVQEENNPRETVKCNGLETDRYVEQEEVKHLIEDEFCPEAGSSRGLRRQGSALSRTYNIDTPNKVTLSVSLDQGHSVTGCVKYLMMTMYNCYRVDNDPSDYKGGGQTIVGDATYEVYPGSLRSPSKYGKQAGCDSTYKFTFNEYWVWGHGWASSDHGEALKKEIKGCTLLPDTWKFTYDIGEYGLGKASGIGDFGCAGSGKWILDIAKNSAYLESRVLPRAFRFGLFIETQ
ncbi:hypothetical protein CEK27_007850 [Fusarium fujikuroi]|nr:hypothetical protein CEK27_007850 [Fusarium fujikuroi]